MSKLEGSGSPIWIQRIILLFSVLCLLHAAKLMSQKPAPIEPTYNKVQISKPGESAEDFQKRINASKD